MELNKKIKLLVNDKITAFMSNKQSVCQALPVYQTLQKTTTTDFEKLLG